MGDEAEELEVLLSLDGARFEAAEGYVVEFTVKRTAKTAERPHGVSYSLVFRPTRGEPYVRFDNAHAASRPGGRFVKTSPAYDHWHRDENRQAIQIQHCDAAPRRFLGRGKARNECERDTQ